MSERMEKAMTRRGPAWLFKPEAILEVIGDAVTVHDREFRVIYQNRAMVELFGERGGDLCHRVYWTRTEPCPDCFAAASPAAGDRPNSVREVELEGKRHVFEGVATPIRNECGEIVACVEIYRDITQRTIAEEKVRRFSDLYMALSHTNKAIMYSPDRNDLFREVCRVAVEYGKFTLAAVGLVDEERALLIPAAGSGSASKHMESIVSIEEGREEGEGPSGVAVRTGIPYICNDYMADPRTGFWRESARVNGIRSSAVFPLRQEGKVTGAFKLYSDSPGFFDDDMVRLLEEMATNISFALDNFCTEEERRKAQEALRQSEERLRYISTHDPLTGLFNRAFFDTELKRLTVSRHYPVSVVVADVDGLKMVNDNFGHAEGDRLIRMAARVLREAFRSDDIVARIGGDEFAVILPETDGEAVRSAVKRVLRLQRVASREIADFSLSLSTGAATAGQGEELLDALKVADARMYYHKLQKKSRAAGLRAKSSI